MALNYASLASGPSADTVTDPQKLFQALPGKAKKYAYLRDVQGDVLGKWHSSRKPTDAVVKMNTGGGKTTVGLLILKSCLNEGVSPAVYVAPDNYLCSQVEKEADDLGLRRTKDPRSPEFQAGRAILIIPVQVLINGMSKFGVGREREIQIGVVVIDDAHACLSVAEEKFTLKIKRDDAGYQPVFELFEEDMRTQSLTGTQEIKNGDQQGFVEVPYWAWLDKQAAVIDILSKQLTGDERKFVWPLVKEDMASCKCFIKSKELEISSRCLPIDMIPSFDQAKRRIFMTATLADDAVLVTAFGASAEAVAQPITPKTASDLGERMILVPGEINSDVTEDEIRTFVKQASSSENVVVIVPSNPRAEFWADVVTEGMILTASNIREGIDRLRTSKGNLAVLVNKYDGIDLPDNSCRILVVDGVPDTRRLIDRYEQGTLCNSDRYWSRQIQRIEQGMGRGIRSNEDYCVVILMGAQLLRALYADGAVRHFSPATKQQLALSRNLAAQISRERFAAIAEPISDVLTRNPGWVAAAKNALIDVAYPAETVVDPVSIAQRQAYVAFRQGKYDASCRLLQDAADLIPDVLVKGWLMEQAAAALHRLDKARSQQLLAAAGDRNTRVSKPLVGIAYTRIDTAGMNQSQQAVSFFINTYPHGGNSVIIGMNGLLADLVFKENGWDEFEQALMDLGLHLGFRAQRPERERTGKLDVLWGIGNLEYLLFPCKSEVFADAISKQYTDQASGNVNWFVGAYDQSCRGTVVIVHPATILEPDATPPPNTRVIGKAELAKLRSACFAYITGIKDRLDDAAHIRASLAANGLVGDKFLQTFTVPPKLKKKQA